jgi:hypothetical protein
MAAVASFPGNVQFAPHKLRRFHPELFGRMPAGGWQNLGPHWVNTPASELFDQLNRRMREGDTRAAVVVELSPLRVAAYSDELDCVTLIRFDEPVRSHLIDEYKLARGSRLITINVYYDWLHVKRELWEGPRAFGRWGYYFPVIGDFLTDDMARLDERRRQISEDEWERTRTFGERVARSRPASADQDGSPFRKTLD